MEAEQCGKLCNSDKVKYEEYEGGFIERMEAAINCCYVKRLLPSDDSADIP